MIAPPRSRYHLITSVALVALTLAGWLATASEAELTAAKPVAATLRCEVRKFAPGENFMIGISLRHRPGFHTYWHSPGTVGLPTMVQWELPPGYEASELFWPVPERCKMEGYNTHGYNRDVTLLATIKVPPDAPLGPVAIHAKLTWMACSEGKCCNLQHATETLTLACDAQREPDPEGAAVIAAARRELPQPYPGLACRFSQTRDAYTLTVTFPATHKLPAADTIYFYGEGQLVDSIRQQTVAALENGFRLTLPRTDYGPEDAPELKGLLYTTDKWPGTAAMHLPVAAKRVTTPEVKP